MSSAVDLVGNDKSTNGNNEMGEDAPRGRPGNDRSICKCKINGGEGKGDGEQPGSHCDGVVEARKAPTHIEIKEMTCDLPSSRINIGSVLLECSFSLSGTSLMLRPAISRSFVSSTRVFSTQATRRADHLP